MSDHIENIFQIFSTLNVQPRNFMSLYMPGKHCGNRNIVFIFVQRWAFDDMHATSNAARFHASINATHSWIKRMQNETFRAGKNDDSARIPRRPSVSEFPSSILVLQTGCFKKNFAVSNNKYQITKIYWKIFFSTIKSNRQKPVGNRNSLCV